VKKQFEKSSSLKVKTVLKKKKTFPRIFVQSSFFFSFQANGSNGVFNFSSPNATGRRTNRQSARRFNLVRTTLVQTKDI
jgi:hypothetical protein